MKDLSVFQTVTLMQEYQDSVIQDSGFSPPDAANDKRLSQVGNCKFHDKHSCYFSLTLFFIIYQTVHAFDFFGVWMVIK